MENTIGASNVQNVANFELFPCRSVEIIHLATPPDLCHHCPIRDNVGNRRKCNDIVFDVVPSSLVYPVVGVINSFSDGCGKVQTDCLGYLVRFEPNGICVL